MRTLGLLLGLAFGAVILAACSDSNKPTDRPATTASVAATSSASASTPKQNFNNPAELAAALKVQWSKETSDPSHAHYREGVTVTKVVCGPDPRPHVSACVVSYSKGDPFRQAYLVSDDGQSFEGVESYG
jgi:hypothetical protein